MIGIVSVHVILGLYELLAVIISKAWYNNYYFYDVDIFILTKGIVNIIFSILILIFTIRKKNPSFNVIPVIEHIPADETNEINENNIQIDINETNPPELTNYDLSDSNLSDSNLTQAELTQAELTQTDLIQFNSTQTNIDYFIHLFMIIQKHSYTILKYLTNITIFAILFLGGYNIYLLNNYISYNINYHIYNDHISYEFILFVSIDIGLCIYMLINN